MQKVIDLALHVPATREEIVQKIIKIFFDPDARGVANYRRIFGPQWAAVMGTSLDEMDTKRREMGEAEFSSLLTTIAETLVVTPEAFIAELDCAGIEWCLVNGETVEDTVRFVQQWPGRTRGIANLNPFDGMKAVRKLEVA